MDSCIPGS
uniref:Retrovirus-related Pol polyprotein from transposon n=1 Tax=Rhizophora mucronata TaxID=61149 RepID=A0A2P2JV33_RHIMU